MDWALTASIATVVVPSFGAFWFVTFQTVKLLIAQNNETLLTRINGTYVKKEVLEEKLKVLPAQHECQHAPRLDKIELDIRNATGSIARAYRAGQ